MSRSIDPNNPLGKTDEAAALCASELACAVADAWVRHPRSWDLDVPVGISRSFSEKLDRLEVATRSSKLRTALPLKKTKR